MFVPLIAAVFLAGPPRLAGPVPGRFIPVPVMTARFEDPGPGKTAPEIGDADLGWSEGGRALIPGLVLPN
jgi:hypothetical protein